MADVIYLWWDEFDRRDLPNRCMRCGKKNADWCGYQFHTWTYENMRRYKVKRKCEIPLCEKHGGGGLTLQAIQARELDKQGVWALNVHEEFVDALKKHRKDEVAAWKEENDNADPKDFDDEKLPPGLRKPPKKPKAVRVSWVWPAVIIGGVLAIFLLFGLGVCAVAVLMPFLARRR